MYCQDIPEQAQQPIIQAPENAHHGGQADRGVPVRRKSVLAKLEATSNAKLGQACQATGKELGGEWAA